MDDTKKGKKSRMEAREADPAVQAARERLGQRIKSLRVAKELTQGQLAEKTGMSQKYLGEVERGLRNVSFEAITVLAKALNVPASSVLDNEHEQTRDQLIAAIVRMAPDLNEHDARIAYRMFTLMTHR